MERQSRQHMRQARRRRLWFRALVAIALALGALVAALHWAINRQNIAALEKPLPTATVIYDEHGRVASKLAAANIEEVPIERVPNHFLQAIVATEDRRFYEHNGVDYYGILRAVWRNVRAGEWVEGGSTITQQLAKNVFLTNEKTLARKWKEWLIAQKIERTYSKKDILEMYINRVYFGAGAWGVASAAKTYFGKDVSELTLSESALLAGLVKAPSALSPLRHYDKAIARRNVVLALMREQGYIDDQEWSAAKSERIAIEQEPKRDPYAGKYPYYVDELIREAITRYGLTQSDVLSGGLHIYTELDPNMQQALEAVYADDSLFPSSPDEVPVQSGAVLLDPKTGGVKALVGGRGRHVFRGFNRATELRRQPGSALKPLAVYTPALEQGYGPFSPLKDEPLDFGGYRPQNYDHTYRGTVTMYEAVIHSLNVPAVWLLNEIGLDKGMDALHRFGLPLEKEDRQLGIALGGMSRGVSPLEMAEAYAAFASDGARPDGHLITKIVDAYGREVAEWKPQRTIVTSEKVAQQMTLLLQGVIREGTGKRAAIPGRELAGKTGSTEMTIPGIDGVKDQWMVGYTPQLVGALWLGYDRPDRTHYLTTTSGETAAVIFRHIMEKALAGQPAARFSLPLVKQEERERKKRGQRAPESAPPKVKETKEKPRPPGHEKGKNKKEKKEKKHGKRHGGKHE
ncbi:penicillin-binding protein [Geobacillus subterraneus]|uniref:Penicillin-binding protein n=2 Tax=Geobacillus TaxID=129337 RepID=A0ABN4NH72_9BACL|nr:MULTISPECIES: PBP1A family penicillin-binding protein [Geobacillus]AMX83701.1 penicillin-binding protein [Geobacillus subterraneus]KZS24404.1 penicillin-binding protein [Geobacillus subterraneus]OXB87915.1 penicillin-binding protein [Geobacillus uzenensis]